MKTCTFGGPFDNLVVAGSEPRSLMVWEVPGVRPVERVFGEKIF